MRTKFQSETLKGAYNFRDLDGRSIKMSTKEVGSVWFGTGFVCLMTDLGFGDAVKGIRIP
jgi:hypothetical protein